MSSNFPTTDDDDFLLVLDDLDNAPQPSADAKPASDAVPPPSAEHLDCLKASFGHSAFRPTQWLVVRTALVERRDCCCIMSTGYGKSLCYQFPAVFARGTTLVVSPLISLMQDQVLALGVANIAAAYLGTAQTDSGSVLRRARAGELRLLYVSPEYVNGSSGRDLLRDMRSLITLVAIDEAHCVSQWGHDFRSSYRRLGDIRQHLDPAVPMLAVTATATERVRADIVRNLRMHADTRLVCTGYDRPNLSFRIAERGPSIWSDLSAYVTNVAGSTIVYCLTRKETERIVECLRAKGVADCAAYHAGLSLAERRTIHERFVRDQLPVIVATVAFGMGIDKPDIRTVVHYGASKSLESYYQEVGRAGRDGQPAQCVMFYATRDFETHALLRTVNGAQAGENAPEQALQMKRFVYASQCRRRQLLEYFGERLSGQPKARPNCCDVCDRSLSTDGPQYADMNAAGEFDFGADAELLLRAIEAFGGRSGLVKPIAMLRGSSAATVSHMRSHAVYGRGRLKCDDYWKLLAEMLECEAKLLERERVQPMQPGAFGYTVIGITGRGQHWLQKHMHSAGDNALWMRPAAGLLRYMRRIGADPKAAGATTAATAAAAVPKNALGSHLMLCRAALAAKHDIMPYMVASNRALEQMTLVRPHDMAAFRAAQLDGFSEAKCVQFGEEFIACIRKNATGSEANAEPGFEFGVLHDLLQRHPMLVGASRVTDAQLRLLPLLAVRPRKALAEVGTECGLKESTVKSYVEALLRAGHAIWRDDLAEWFGVTERLFERIAGVLPADDVLVAGVTLRSVKEQLPDVITWDQIRMVIAYCAIRAHLRVQDVRFEEPDPFGNKASATEAEPPTDALTDSPAEEEEQEPVSDEAVSLDKAEIAEMLEDMNIPVESQNTSDVLLDDDEDSMFDDLGGAEECSTVSDAKPPPPEPLTATAQKPARIAKPKGVQYADSDEENADNLNTAKPVQSGKRVLPAWMSKDTNEAKRKATQ